MPPSNEKMWNTNYMDTYNKRKPPRKSYKYRKPLVVPKETAIDTSYLDQRPKTSSDQYKITAADQQEAINAYFANLCLQDVSPSTIPHFLDPSGDLTSDPNMLDSSQHYMYDILNAADSLHARTEQLQNQKHTQECSNLVENIRSGATPVPSPPKEPRSKTPDPRQDYHWICWPEPENKSSSKEKVPHPPRPNTSLGINWPIPRPGNSADDIEDRPSSTEPGYVFGDQEEITRGPPMTFVPELQSWINAASDYDKAFIYRMMALNGTLPMIPPQHMRPRRETTYTFGQTKLPMSTQTYLPNPYAQRWVPGGGNMSPRALPSLPQMQRSYTDLDDLNNARRYLRPQMSKSQDYVHEHSMFMTTQPLCRGHFIIHPDWVSERLPRRKMTPFKKNRQSMRYGSMN
ncbi:uncharacterized protein LOC132553980 [Ylistrum balloti]|uniref:uncharacterized protein LOC132553980 n=1 Tax=Ylistrum balloti TaxID=509963 RepID=UPI002905E067|nr:uncharacterized protein LOC132553980 [Ylistrum balloti]